jgi:hypothetical protein
VYEHVGTCGPDNRDVRCMEDWDQDERMVNLAANYVGKRLYTKW